MRRILPVERIRLEYHAHPDEVRIGLHDIREQDVQCITAACLRRCRHQRVDVLPQIQPRLLDRLIAADHGTRLVAQLVVLRPRPRSEKFVIGTIANK